VSAPAKARADQLLVERGLAESRAKAQALILAGQVYSGTRRIDKPGQQLADDAPLAVKGQDHPWVSRGGLKLAKALDHFAIDPAGLVCLDVGASTGGFTDVLLSRGAARVYAVDVGRGQLAWKLRQDPRVVVLERTNARYLTAAQVPEPLDLVVCDASFIGLETVLPAPLALTGPGARLIALIKPQFEVGKGRVGKGGVVRDPALHDEVCRRIAAWLDGLPDWRVLGLAESPILGPEGNKEFLIAAARCPRDGGRLGLERQEARVLDLEVLPEPGRQAVVQGLAAGLAGAGLEGVHHGAHLLEQPLVVGLVDLVERVLLLAHELLFEGEMRADSRIELAQALRNSCRGAVFGEALAGLVDQRDQAPVLEVDVGDAGLELVLPVEERHGPSPFLR
jgi:23S rRNA (cytidine1920-2'-O)/16S rRNA (cytidine1409-2'-O)-methyltransferase